MFWSVQVTKYFIGVLLIVILTDAVLSLEIYHGYILQAKGKNDSAPPAEVQEWLRQYADKHHLIIHEKAYAHAGQYYV